MNEVIIVRNNDGDVILVLSASDADLDSTESEILDDLSYERFQVCGLSAVIDQLTDNPRCIS